MSRWLGLIIVMPPMGLKWGTHGLKTTSSQVQRHSSRGHWHYETRKWWSKHPTDICKTSRTSQLLPGETLPVVELDKIGSAEGGEGMPPSDAPGPIIPTCAQDEEMSCHWHSQSTTEATTNSGSSWRLQFVNTTWWSCFCQRWGANGAFLTIPKKMENAQFTCLPATCTKHTGRFDLHHNWESFPQPECWQKTWQKPT